MNKIPCLYLTSVISVTLLFSLCGLPIMAQTTAMLNTEAEELLQFDSPEQKQRYQNLLAQLRCLVCQNQSLADSDAGLAQDLRERVYSMLLDDASDAEIIEFMVARYGDFVLYKPPLNRWTLLLWFGPFLLVGVGAVILVWVLISRNERQADAVLNEKRRQRAADLLK